MKIFIAILLGLSLMLTGCNTMLKGSTQQVSTIHPSYPIRSGQL